MKERMEKLERQLKWMELYAALLTTALVTALMFPPLTASQEKEEQAGRERILLGAPIPSAGSRVRTDLGRVKEVWGRRFPREYLKWYREYRHEMNGLLILDENGFDRLALGDPVPDPNIGKRIGPATGLAINDEQGFERSGYGLLKVQGAYRVVLGLDSANGAEGLTLALLDEGSVGLGVRNGQRTIYLGIAPPGDAFTGIAEPFHGLVLRHDKEVKYQINAARQQ